MTVAALYVQKGGCYWDLPNVDAWDQERDARLYDGPWPVVAHPPCERWGRYWGGGPSASYQRKLGDDAGCFEAALASVRKWSGILEHPEGSHAWRVFQLNLPPKSGAWVMANWVGGWTCCVEQGTYGHRARKATWLYANGVELPSLHWGKSAAKARLEQSFRSADHRRQAKLSGDIRPYDRITSKEHAATPIPFRDLLISIAESANREQAA